MNEDADSILLSVCSAGWRGDSSKVLVKAASQKRSGRIKVGNDSVLAHELTDGSIFEGSVDGSNVDRNGYTLYVNGTALASLTGKSHRETTTRRRGTEPAETSLSQDISDV